MKKVLFSAAAVLALASCSNDSLVGDSPVSNEAPIEFTAGQRNITRGENSNKLEDNGYRNFGVWAYKYTSGDKLTSALVMANYEVGCAGYGDYSTSISKGTWYYEGLGTGNTQVLRYWDLSYNNTKFFAYAPYNTAVSFDESTKKMTVPVTVNVASNTNDFVYANTTMTNSSHATVPLAFKHIGAKVNLKFYEDVAGYKVQLIDVTTDGTGIQLTPATLKEGAYTNANLYTAYEAVIDFSKSPVTVDATDLEDDKKYTVSQDNLVFGLPTTTELPTTSSSAVASPTTYYGVAQPSSSETGFTLHVSYKLIADDNSEEITVRDARVYIPAKDDQDNRIAVWESNKAYTYTFKITKDTTGSTGGDTTPTITEPTVPTNKGLYPIVFENITIEDYTAVGSEY